jgi:integrase
LALPSAGPIFSQPSASPEITSAYLIAENSGLGIRQDGDTLVCGRVDGAPHLPQSITYEFNRFIAKLALPRVTFHGLRHSHATQLLASGVHPKIAPERLGHSAITTTLDLYSHVTDTMQVEAAEKLNAAWLGSKSGSNEAPPEKMPQKK